MIDIAFVGVGHIHTPGFIKSVKARSNEIRVKYVWDHDAARAKKRAEEVGAPVAELATIWGDKDVKGVIITSETKWHEELVPPAAKAKKHMFVEKPMGMGAKDGYAMLKVIEKAGVMFQTGYFNRGNPAYLFLREQVQKGTFGKIVRVHGSNCHNGALGGWFDTEWRWMADPAQAGVGAFGDLGTHMLDIMLWLLGDVTTATGSMNKGTGRYGDCDEVGEGLMTFANGTVGALSAGWDDLADPVSLLISGTEAHATVINGELFFKANKVEGADGKKPWTQLGPGKASGLDSFFNALLGDTNAQAQLVTAREAAYRSAVMEAMYQGSRTGKWVKVKQVPAR
jgi:predicted dehydrogenase